MKYCIACGGILPRDHATECMYRDADTLQELADARKALEQITELVSWHYDPEADPSNMSPDDNVAHVNGLVWQICRRVLDEDREK